MWLQTSWTYAPPLLLEKEKHSNIYDFVSSLVFKNPRFKTPFRLPVVYALAPTTYNFVDENSGIH